MADIRMPDGTVIRGVPDGVSQNEVLRRLALQYGEDRVAQMTGGGQKPAAPAASSVSRSTVKASESGRQPAQNTDYDQHFSAASKRDRHPTGFLQSQAMTESSMNPRAQSDVGAQGLMQIMPETQKELGITDPFDPQQSIDKGSAYLRRTIDHFGGDVEKGIAAYHSGMGNVRKWEKQYGDKWQRGLGPQGAKYTKELADKYKQFEREDVIRTADEEVANRAELDAQYPDRLKPEQLAKEITAAGDQARLNSDLLAMGNDSPVIASNTSPTAAMGVKVDELVNSGMYTARELNLDQAEFDLRKRPPMQEADPEYEKRKNQYYGIMTEMGTSAAAEMYPDVAERISADSEMASAERAALAESEDAREAPDNTVRNWANSAKVSVVEGFSQVVDGIKLFASAGSRESTEHQVLGKVVADRISEEYEDLDPKVQQLLKGEAEKRGMSVKDFAHHNVQQFIKYGMEEAETLENLAGSMKAIQDAAPKGAYDTTLGYYGNALLQQTPQVGIILAGLATGSPALVGTLFSTYVYGQTYGHSRLEGKTHDEATMDGAVATLFEVSTEMLPLQRALSLIKQGKRGRIVRGAEVAGLEASQEMLVEALQMGYDYGVYDETVTFGEAMVRLRDAGIIGAAMGTMIAGPAIAMMDSDMANAQEGVEDAKKELASVARRMQNPNIAISAKEVQAAKDNLKTAVQAREKLIQEKKEADREKKKAKAEKKDVKRRKKLTPEQVKREDKAREQNVSDQTVKGPVTNELLEMADMLERASSAEMTGENADEVSTLLDAGYAHITKSGTLIVLPAGKRRLKAIREAETRQGEGVQDEVIEPVKYDTPDLKQRRAQRQEQMRAVDEEIGRRMRGEAEPVVAEPVAIKPKPFKSAEKRKMELRDRVDSKIANDGVIERIADEIVKAEEIEAEYDRKEAAEAAERDKNRDEGYQKALESQRDLEADVALNLAHLDQSSQSGYKGTQLGKVLREAYKKLEQAEAKAKKQLEDSFWNKPVQGTLFDLGGALAKGSKDYANLVKVGALKLAKHGTKYSAWVADMVGEFSENIKPVLSQVWHDSKKMASDLIKVTHEKFQSGDRKGELKFAPQKYAKPGQIRTLRTLLAKLAEEGEPGRFWYEKSGKEIMAITGGNMEEARKLAGLLAIYSSGTGVGPNLTNALKMWAQFQAGNLAMPKQGTKAGRFGEQDRTAIEWLQSHESDEYFAESFGNKRFPFFKNIMREIDPDNYEAGQGVTVDLWMMRAFGYDAISPTDPQFAFAAVEIKELADKLGWEKQQVQAAVWVAIKARWEFIQKEAKQQSVDAGLAEWVPASKGKNEFVVVGNTREEQIVNEKKVADIFRTTALRKSVTEIQKKLQESKADFADYLENHYATMSWEAQPSSKLTPDFDNMAIEDRIAMQAEIAEILINPKTGREYIAEWLGLLGNRRITASGAWDMSVGITMQNDLLVPPRHKGSADKVKSSQPEAVEAMNSYAAIMGYLLGQDGVAWHRPYFGQTKKTSNGVELNSGTLTREQTIAFYGALVNVAKESGIDQKAASYFAPVVLNGVTRVFNFNENIDNNKFHEMVAEAADRAKIKGNLEVFQADGGVVENDWSDYPKGEEYVNQINNAKNPEVQKAFGRAKSRFAKRIKEVHDKYAAKHGSLPTEKRPISAPLSLARILAGGESASAEILTRFGNVDPTQDTTEQLKIYDLDIMIENERAADELARSMGFEVKVFSFHEDPDAGVEFVLPRLKTQGYDKGYVWIYDPRVADASFKDVDYTRAWRVSHEIGHAVTEKYMAAKYGPSKRYGRLGREHKVLRGVPPKQKEVSTRALTLIEAQRAVEWEDVAFRAQREILSRMGIEISEEQFNKEYAINISDAMYRVMTGEFNDPGERGFMPDGKPVNLRAALKLLENFEAELALKQGRKPTEGIDIQSWRKTPISSIRSAINQSKPSDLKLSEHSEPQYIRIKENEFDEFEVREKNGEIYYASEIEDAIGTAYRIYGREVAIDIVDEFYEVIDTIDPPSGPAPKRIALSSRVDNRQAIDDFMDDFREETTQNPLDPDTRILDNKSGISLRPQKDVVWLDSIHAFEKGEGEGNTALKLVLGLADTHGVTLNLFSKPYGEGGLDQESLNDWYSRNGFVREKGSSVWVRNPQAAETAKFSMFGKRPTRKTNEGWGVEVAKAEQYASVLMDHLDINNIEVVESFEDLPDDLYDKIRILGKGGLVRGVYDENAAEGPRIYIIANNIWDGDVTSSKYGEPDYVALMELLLHETVGHFGLAAMLSPKQYNAIMDSIRANFMKEMKELVPNFEMRERAGMVGKRLNAEEYFAYTIQSKKRGVNLSKKQMNLWQKILFAVRTKLIEMGMGKVTDKYIEDLMSRVVDYTRNTSVQKLQKRALQNEKMRKAETKLREAENLDADMKFSLRSPSLKRARKEDADLDRFLSKIGHGTRGPIRKLRDWYEMRRSNMMRVFEIQMLDQFAGIRHLEEDLGIVGPESGYMSVRLTTATDVVIRSAMENGIPEWTDEGVVRTKEGTRGLVEILAPVAQNPEMLKVFEAWIVARRASRLTKESREKLLKRGEIASVFKYIRKNKLLSLFKETAADLAEYKKGVLDFAEEAGVIDSDGRAIWEHHDHVPFYRVIAGHDKVGPFAASRIGHLGKTIHRLKGGTDPLKKPLESIVQNLSMLIEGSMKNRAMSDVIRNFEGTGVITKAPQAVTGQAIVPLKQVREMLWEAGVAIDMVGNQLLSGIAKLTTLETPNAKNVVSVQVNGKKQYYFIHDEGVMTGLNGVTPNQWYMLMTLLRLPKRVLTLMITRMPDFILKNWFRDTWHTYMLQRHGQVIPGYDSIKGWSKAIAEDDTFKDVLSGGGIFDSGYVNATDPKKTSIAIRRSLLGKGRHNLLDTPAKLARFYVRIANGAENAHRLVVYEKTLKKTGSRKQALFESRDLMDFSVRGANPIIRFLTETVPFWGARVQGITRTGKAFKENPTMTALRAIPVVLASVALYALNRDDDRYKSMNDYEKRMYYHFFDVFEDGDHWRLPKPFEVGAMFSTIPEIITEYALSQEPDRGEAAAHAIFWTVREMFALAPDIQAINPLLELYKNENSFTEAPIISEYDKMLPPEQQFSARTNKTIIDIARSMPEWAPEAVRSPKQLEHLVRGYLGSVVDYGLFAADYMHYKTHPLDPAPPALRKDEMPFIKAFMREEHGKYDIYLETMYDVLEEANKIHNAINSLRKQGGAEARAEIKEYEEENAELLFARQRMDPARQRIATINKRIRAVYENKKMSPTEKRDAIDVQLQRRREAAEKVYNYRPGGTKNKYSEGEVQSRVDEVLELMTGKEKKQQVDGFIDAGLPHTAILINDITISNEKLETLE
jgi:hypothetical protein